jgi:hypothetical protein
MMTVLARFANPCARAFVVLAGCAVLPLGPSLAAADEPRSPKPVRNWSIEFALGASIGGPLDDIESAMEAAGFGDDIDLGQEWGEIKYPIHSSDSSSAWGAVRRRVGDGRWMLGLGAGWTNFGSVIGNHNVEGEPYARVSLDSEVEMMTLAPMAWYQVLPAARLGAGIAANRVDTSVGQSYGIVNDSSSWEAGLVVEAAVTYPPASRFYFLMLVQYQWLQDGTIGPWQDEASNGEVVVFPESEVALSHGLVAVGLGIRF